MDLLSKFLLPGILFLFTLFFGFWLSKIGRPYHVVLFNVHKLVALAVVASASVQVFRLLKSSDPHALTILLLGVAVICVVALFASGALMSGLASSQASAPANAQSGAVKLDYNLLRAVHRIALLILVIVLALAAYQFWEKLL